MTDTRAPEPGWEERTGHREGWVPRGLGCEERKTEKYPTSGHLGACIREMQMQNQNKSRLTMEDVEEVAG